MNESASQKPVYSSTYRTSRILSVFSSTSVFPSTFYWKTQNIVMNAVMMIVMRMMKCRRSEIVFKMSLMKYAVELKSRSQQNILIQSRKSTLPPKVLNNVAGYTFSPYQRSTMKQYIYTWVTTVIDMSKQFQGSPVKYSKPSRHNSQISLFKLYTQKSQMTAIPPYRIMRQKPSSSI